MSLPVVVGPHVIIQCPECKGSGKASFTGNALVALDPCGGCKGLTVVKVPLAQLTILAGWEADMDEDPTH